MADFEDMGSAFACKIANCRAEVLEELINETDRQMFFERVLSTPQYVTIPTRCISSRPHSVATSWVRVRTRSSSWLRMRFRLFGGTCGRWRCRDRHRQDWYAIWDSRFLLEHFEALEHSDRVLDEELEGGGWKRNMDKREVVPMMKGKRPGFDLAGKGQGIVAGARHLGGTLHRNGRDAGDQVNAVQVCSEAVHKRFRLDE